MSEADETTAVALCAGCGYPTFGQFCAFCLPMTDQPMTDQPAA
jgi:hypothetical protein